MATPWWYSCDGCNFYFVFTTFDRRYLVRSRAAEEKLLMKQTSVLIEGCF